MNKFKYDEAKNKLVLDIGPPIEQDFQGKSAMDYEKANDEWESRLSYSLSPELKAMLTNGQILNENEFALKEERVQMFSELIAMPLPEACTHLPLVYTGIGYYHCPACNKGWTYEEWAKEVEQTNKPQEDKPERLFTAKEMCEWAQWLCDSNWGEKQTWGKHDPPSMPTMKELLTVFIDIKNNQP